MLTICTWLWGEKYGREYVDRLFAGVKRHLNQPCRFLLARPDLDGPDAELIKAPGCFVRLRMFDPAWQKSMGVKDRLACLDLDAIITGPLDTLFDRPEPFLILQGANAANPCPYNGSLMMLRAGAHPEAWSDFTLAAAGHVPFYEFPDDQGWLAHKIPNAAGWNAGRESGVYAFEKPGWPPGKGNALPWGARMVCFPGWRDPSKFAHLDWVQEHWLQGAVA